MAILTSFSRGASICTEGTMWSGFESDVAKAILEKIAFCQDQEVLLPEEVFNALALAKKNIATELAVFNDKGEVYLVQRPSLDEKPLEPYPSKWSLPGTIHNKNDYPSTTLRRLEKMELGGAKIKKFHWAGQDDLEDEQRGMTHHIVIVAKTYQDPDSPRGRFYKIDEINHKEVIKNQSRYLLPLAIRMARELHWTS